MFEHTQNNHFKFGYQGQPWYALRTNDSGSFCVEYGKAKRTDGVWDFGSALRHTAKVIDESTELRPNVLMSGGIDSEMVCRAFVDNGVTPLVTIGVMSDNLNLHDVSHAVVYCQQNGIDYDLVDIPIAKIFPPIGVSGIIRHYSTHGQTFSPQLCVTMYLMDKAKGLPILGAGECLVEHVDSTWVLLEKERIASWYRFAMGMNRPAIPGFFQYTPEIMYWYLTDPLVQNMVSVFSDVQSSTVIKHDVYQHTMIGMDLRRRLKFTGYEKIQLKDKHVRDILKTEGFDKYDDIAYTPYEKLIQPLDN